MRQLLHGQIVQAVAGLSGRLPLRTMAKLPAGPRPLPAAARLRPGSQEPLGSRCIETSLARWPLRAKKATGEELRAKVSLGHNGGPTGNVGRAA
mmetsp:Transcript_34807/g.75905  ORF Transcript_34807/g.75905 Transcript_34807/m.75905 type:complete len:94 (+) Transcript_34807:906-1187(+)